MGRRVVLAILQAKGQLPQQQHMQNETNAPDIAAWETGSNGPKKNEVVQLGIASKMCTLIWKNDEPFNFRYFSTLGQSQKSWQENRKATGNPGTSHGGQSNLGCSSHGADGTSKLTDVARKMWTLH